MQSLGFFYSAQMLDQDCHHVQRSGGSTLISYLLLNFEAVIEQPFRFIESTCNPCDPSQIVECPGLTPFVTQIPGHFQAF